MRKTKAARKSVYYIGGYSVLRTCPIPATTLAIAKPMTSAKSVKTGVTKPVTHMSAAPHSNKHLLLTWRGDVTQPAISWVAK